LYAMRLKLRGGGVIVNNIRKSGNRFSEEIMP
jgi:hypothetical protein